MLATLNLMVCKKRREVPRGLVLLTATPGHMSSTLWKDVADDASYLITSEWSDEAAFKAFVTSEAFRAVTTWGKEQILSGRPQHKVYKH